MKRVIAVLLAAAIMLFAAGCGEQASPPQTPSSSAAESGGMDVTVVEVSGSAHVLHGDGTTGVLAPGSILGAGDSLITDRESTVELRLGGLDTLITVSPSSEIFLDRSLAADSGRELILVVRKGSVSNSVDVKLQAGDIYEVCTGDMTMAIRGTNALVDSRDGVTSVSLLTGTALVYNYFDGETYVVPSGVTGRFYSNDEPVFELIELGRYEEVSPAAKALHWESDSWRSQ